MGRIKHQETRYTREEEFEQSRLKSQPTELSNGGSTERHSIDFVSVKQQRSLRNIARQMVVPLFEERKRMLLGQFYSSLVFSSLYSCSHTPNSRHSRSIYLLLCEDLEDRFAKQFKH